MFSLILAVDEEWGIGKNGDLLIKIPEDMKFFKEMTKGSIIIMGRKTFDSLPGKQPLKNRMNVVLTGEQKLELDGVYIYHSIDDILTKFKDQENVFIIGGGQIYQQFLPYCKKAYITKIHKTFNADTFISNLDEDHGWEMIYESNLKIYRGITYQFCIYEKE